MARFKATLVCLLCIACNWTKGETITNETNADVADVAIAVLVEQHQNARFNPNLPKLSLLQFIRRLNVGPQKTRISVYDRVNKIVTLKFEKGTVFGQVATAIEELDLSVTSKETLTLPKIAEAIRDAFDQPLERNRPLIFVFFLVRNSPVEIKNAKQILEPDGADILVAFDTASTMRQVHAYAYAEDKKLEVTGKRHGRIGVMMAELVQMLLDNCSFTKAIICHYNRSKDCVASVRYEYPTEDRYCWKEENKTIRCPFGIVKPCEETCDQLGQWSECSETVCGFFGTKKRKPSKHPLTANCPRRTVVCVPEHCAGTSTAMPITKTTPRKKPRKTVRLGVVVLATVLASVGTFTGVGLYCAVSMKRKAIKRARATAAGRMISAQSAISPFSTFTSNVTQLSWTTTRDAVSQLFSTRRSTTDTAGPR